MAKNNEWLELAQQIAAKIKDTDAEKKLYNEMYFSQELEKIDHALNVQFAKYTFNIQEVILDYIKEELQENGDYLEAINTLNNAEVAVLNELKKIFGSIASIDSINQGFNTIKDSLNKLIMAAPHLASHAKILDDFITNMQRNWRDTTKDNSEQKTEQILTYLNKKSIKKK